MLYLDQFTRVDIGRHVKTCYTNEPSVIPKLIINRRNIWFWHCLRWLCDLDYPLQCYFQILFHFSCRLRLQSVQQLFDLKHIDLEFLQITLAMKLGLWS